MCVWCVLLQNEEYKWYHERRITNAGAGSSCSAFAIRVRGTTDNPFYNNNTFQFTPNYTDLLFKFLKGGGLGGAFPFWKCLIYWKQKIQMPHSLQNEVLARKDHADICLAIFAVIILLIRFIILKIWFGFINYFRPKMHFYKVFPAEITQVPA